MSSADKHIPARDMQFHRNASDLRAHRREQDMHPDRAFASERAADERTNDPHILSLEPERARQNVLHTFHELGRVVERQILIALPMRDRARHLDRIVRFRRRDVGLLDLDQTRVFQRRLHVALLKLHRRVVVLLRLLRFFCGCFHRKQRLFRSVTDFD